MRFCYVSQITNHLLGEYVRIWDRRVAIRKSVWNKDTLYKNKQYSRLETHLNSYLWYMFLINLMHLTDMSFFTSKLKILLVSTVTWTGACYRDNGNEKINSLPPNSPLMVSNVDKIFVELTLQEWIPATLIYFEWNAKRRLGCTKQNVRNLYSYGPTQFEQSYFHIDWGIPIANKILINQNYANMSYISYR